MRYNILNDQPDRKEWIKMHQVVCFATVSGPPRQIGSAGWLNLSKKAEKASDQRRG